MPSYYDALNDAYKLFELNPPASSTQLVYLHLLHLNNRLGNGGQVQISDRELSFRTKLSQDSITKAKRTLKNLGLIDFSSKHGKSKQVTVYTVTFFSEKAVQIAVQRVGQKAVQIAGQSGLVPYTQVREEKDRDSRADAHVCEGDVAGATKPQVSNTRTLPLSSPTSSDADANRIHEEWVKEIGTSLRKDQLAELAKLAKQDYPRAQVAIARTKANNPTNPFAYFKGVYSKLTTNEVATQAPTKASPPKYTDTAEQELMFGMKKEEDD